MGQRSIRFPDGLEARAEAVAKAEDRSFSYIVVRALEKALCEPGDQPPGPSDGSGGLPVNSGGRTPPASSRAPVEKEPPPPPPIPVTVEPGVPTEFKEVPLPKIAPRRIR